MKKYFWKKAVSIFLAGTITLGLSACGNSDDNKGNGNNNSLAKQNVYAYENIDLSELGEDYNIQDMAYIDGKVYLAINSYGWSNSNGGAITRDATIEPLSNSQASEESQEGEDDSSEDTSQDGDSQGSEDTSAEGDSQSSDSASQEGDIDTGVEEPIEDMGVYINTYSIFSFELDGSDKNKIELEGLNTGSSEGQSTYLNNMKFGTDNDIYGIQETYIEDYSDPQNPIYESREELVCWSLDGSQKWTKSLDELKGDSEYMYISSLILSKDGSIYLTVNADNNNKIIVLDQSGNISKQVDLSGSDFENMNSCYQKADGSLVVTTYNNEWTKMYAVPVNIDTGAIGEKVELPGTITSYNMYQGTQTDFLLTSRSGGYTYNIGDTEPVQFISFVNSDLPTTEVQNIKWIDDKSFIGIYYDSVDYKATAAIFTKRNPEDIPDKEVLVVGCSYLDSDIRKRIVDFNKTNSKYRITVREYSEYNTSDDYMAGYTKLNNDIIAGSMPDILIADAQMPVENYIARGLIADIGELIDKDSELSRDNYMENVFKAFSVNDKLYYIVPCFSVGTVIAKSSIVGQESGWTMEEMQAVLNANPEAESFGEMDRNSFFYNLMNYCGNDFIDQSTGKCNFESQEFLNVLEFAKTLPEEINYDEIYGENYDYNKYQLQYRENRTLLMMQYIYNIRDINYAINGQFGEDVTFIGFPNENRKGSIINANLSIVLSAKSKSLDGAWEFVRYYLTDEYQNSDQRWGMSVNKNIFKQEAQEALERPYYIDENGNKVEYDENFYINGEDIPLPTLTQQQVDKIVSFVESVDRRGYYNDSIINVITEEIAPFFAGQKSAQEAAAIIQSRAQVYINENR